MNNNFTAYNYFLLIYLFAVVIYLRVRFIYFFRIYFATYFKSV